MEIFKRNKFTVLFLAIDEFESTDKSNSIFCRQ